VKSVLDACCGPRMFWFDKADPRALFVDNRSEQHTVTDCSHGKAWGKRSFAIKPDIIASFESLPFRDGTFPLVVFDPPHIKHGGHGFMVKKYGILDSDWRDVLRHGFEECFRVLCPLGTLIFKWSDCDIPVKVVLALTPEKPLFGQRCGAKARTHWIVFMKPEIAKRKTAQTGLLSRCAP
jgi:SAM-dependent methyltransferase